MAHQNKINIDFFFLLCFVIVSTISKNIKHCTSSISTVKINLAIFFILLRIFFFDPSVWYRNILSTNSELNRCLYKNCQFLNFRTLGDIWHCLLFPFFRCSKLSGLFIHSLSCELSSRSFEEVTYYHINSDNTVSSNQTGFDCGRSF